MAKKKGTKSTKGKTTRRRRLSGIGSGGALNTALGMIAGAVVGNIAANKLAAMPALAKQKNPGLITGVAVAAAGLFGPTVLKMPALAPVFQGMIAAGGVKVVAATGILSNAGLIAGINDDDAYQIGMMSDYDDDAVSGLYDISGLPSDDGLAGLPAGEALAGY